MEKEFIPYEQALALKELGFDEPCIGFWWNNKDFTEPEFLLEHCEHVMEGNLKRPLYQQAFRWFREKYGLQHKPWSGKISTVFYGYDILNLEEQEFVINNSENGGGDCDYDTYEEAELECLKKLIEIALKK